MSRHLLPVVWLAFLVAPVTAGAAGAPALPEAKLQADYSATLLGIPVGRVTWTVDVRRDQFTAVANGETSGLLRIFAQGHGTANAQGIVSAKQPVASNFLVNYVAGRSSNEVKIVFSGGKAKETLTPAPKPDPSAVPLTDAYRTGVVDPMTALLIRVPGSGEVSASVCQRRIAVFDGHMRYDLQLGFKRLANVRAQKGYQGPAAVCSVTFFPLAGYDPGRSGIKYLQAQRGIEIWLAPVADTRLFAPYRVLVPTPLGPGVLEATNFVATPQAHAANAN